MTALLWIDIVWNFHSLVKSLSLPYSGEIINSYTNKSRGKLIQLVQVSDIFTRPSFSHHFASTFLSNTNTHSLNFNCKTRHIFAHLRLLPKTLFKIQSGAIKTWSNIMQYSHIIAMIEAEYELESESTKDTSHPNEWAMGCLFVRIVEKNNHIIMASYYILQDLIRYHGTSSVRFWWEVELLHF